MKKYFFILVNRLRWLLASLCSPQTCLLCGKSSADKPFCSDCLRTKLDNLHLQKPRCQKCGKLLISEKELCTVCRTEPVLIQLDRCFPLYSYHLWAKEILFAWKIEDCRSLSLDLARRIFTVYSELFAEIPVVPVPPRPGKIKKRGWDQVQELCQYLAVFYKLPIMPLLQRVSTVQQKKLDREQRLHQKEQRYVLLPNKHVPERVVLLDDILTTGSTLEECAKVLKVGGVKEVYAVTLFTAD